MSSNKLSTNISLVIGENNLKKLNLSHNLLLTIDRKFLGNSQKLETLDLSLSEIKSIDKNSFNSSKILNLNLNFNNIEDCQFLEPLNLIEALDLKENSIRSIKLSNPELKYLNLENNKIENVDFDKSLMKLETLNLRNNPTLGSKTSNFDFLEKLPNLKSLNLENSQILTVGVIFQKLKKIENIFLSRNLLQQFDVSSKLEFVDLKSIDLSFCDLRGIDSNILKTSFPKLVILSIFQRIKKLINFIYFYSLQKLSIGGNPWECNSLDELVKVLREKGILFQHFDGPACLTSLGTLQDFYKV